MLKRILVALDPDPDTPVATRYAIRLAKKFDASLTGLAIVNMEDIYSTVGGGGIGTIYYAKMHREYMSETGREEASRLLKVFKEKVEKAEVRHSEVMEEGVPYERIIEDTKYHDLLVVGRDSHFFYNKPEQETDTLAKVVKNGVAPALVVTDVFQEAYKVMIAFDGSTASARTLQHFIHLMPYGKDIEVEVVHVSEGDSRDDVDESALILRLAEEYLKSHGFVSIEKTILKKGNPGKRLLERQEETESDILLLGAHSVSAIKRMAFGSTTHSLITESPIPLFISH